MLSDGKRSWFSNPFSPVALNALNALNTPKAQGKCIHFYKRLEVLRALSAVERNGCVERKTYGTRTRQGQVIRAIRAILRLPIGKYSFLV
jgi:hypothetical protein